MLHKLTSEAFFTWAGNVAAQRSLRNAIRHFYHVAAAKAFRTWVAYVSDAKYQRAGLNHAQRLCCKALDVWQRHVAY